MLNEFEAGKLKVKVYEDRAALGAAAAAMAAATIRETLKKKYEVNIVFAAAASQNEFLAALIKEDIGWSRVNAFHMDEYIGLPAGAPQQFGYWLRERIFGKLNFKEVFYLDGQAPDAHAECERYARLLQQHPTDICFMGIGENTHLAFNDPHVANFSDTALVKVVDLDEACKQQQVNEDCFDDISQIPPDAFTLTIPALLSAKTIYCMVPGILKAPAVYHTIKDPINEKYPSTILRTHDNALLLLDRESASKLLEERQEIKSVAN